MGVVAVDRQDTEVMTTQLIFSGGGQLRREKETHESGSTGWTTYSVYSILMKDKHMRNGRVEGGHKLIDSFFEVFTRR